MTPTWETKAAVPATSRNDPDRKPPVNTSSTTSVFRRVRLSTRSDEHLLVRAREGDARAFEELYRRFSVPVFGFCMMRLSNRQAAEDATQEVFLKVGDATGSPVDNVKAWIFTVARNVVIDFSRRKAATPEFAEMESVMDSIAHSNDETAFSALDVTTNVYIALRRLASRERQALIYREFQDWPSQRIAKELNLRPGNVDVILCRARAAFGTAYAEIADLPVACRQATETIYRDLGSGATEHRLGTLKAHLAICPRCQAEYRRAHSPRFVAGLVPWLWVGTQINRLTPLVARTRSTLGETTSHIDRIVPPGWAGPAKATIVMAIAATAFAPGVMRYASTRHAEAGTASQTTASARRADVQLPADGGAHRFQSSTTAGMSTSHQDERLPGQMHDTSAHSEPAHDDATAAGHESATHADSGSGSTASGHDSLSKPSATTQNSHVSDGSHTAATPPPTVPADTHTGTEATHE